MYPALSEAEGAGLLTSIVWACPEFVEGSDILVRAGTPALSLYWNFLRSRKQANSKIDEESTPKTGITSWCGAGALAREGSYRGTSSDVPHDD
jgi:hypothetical protein